MVYDASKIIHCPRFDQQNDPIFNALSKILYKEDV